MRARAAPKRAVMPARTAHTRLHAPAPHRYLPYIGMVTIIMNDYPIVKYILVGLMGLFVLTTKE